MKNYRTYVTSALFSGLIAFPTLVNATESLRKISLHSSFGTIDNTNLDNELNDIDTNHYSFEYDYSFTDYVAVGAGYLYGDSDALATIPSLFTDSSLEYRAVVVSIKLQAPITERNALYLNLGALNYDYDITDDGEVVGDDDGTDFVIGAGWRYVFDIGIGVEVGYDRISLGSDIDIDSVGFGLSYSF